MGMLVVWASSGARIRSKARDRLLEHRQDEEGFSTKDSGKEGVLVQGAREGKDEKGSGERSSINSQSRTSVKEFREGHPDLGCQHR